MMLVNPASSTNEVMRQLKACDFHFPVIFKPDLGERGFMVKRIKDEKDIHDYLKKININFIVQELIDFPVELGVFYTRFPSREKGEVTSITMKEMLHVCDDGKSTLRELILCNDRAKLQWPILKVVHGDRLQAVVPMGEVVELVSIGNHCLGTKFIDANYLINQKLSDTFDSISKQIPGFYFGRFDLRCASIEQLYDGHIKIMELNGCGAEPAHVYNPGYSLRKAIAEFCLHWRNIFLISRENNNRGVPYTSMRDAFRYYKTFKASSR